MKHAMSGFDRIAAIGMVLAMCPVQTWAGGEVDTSVDAFLAADFTTNPSGDITNPWWTLPAGSNFLYFAEAEDGCEWNLVEVLALTTDNFGGPYAGTDARVILDREWIDEECLYETFVEVSANLDPAEVTYDWYAQDSELNVWYLGEHTIDDEGSSAGSFTAGCDGAEAGIVMLGNPDKGLSYQQEYYEGEAEDRAKVLTFVSDDDADCLKTKEWTPLDPGHQEHKFYCSDGVTGELVLIEGLKGKNVVVELIDTNVSAPPAPPGPPNPIPADC